jgi:hypothetical protein
MLIFITNIDKGQGTRDKGQGTRQGSQDGSKRVEK